MVITNIYIDCQRKWCFKSLFSIFIALCQFSVTVAGFGLFLFGPVKLRIRPRTLCRLTFSVFSLLLSRGLDKGSDDPRPLLAKIDRSDTLSTGAVVNPLALTTQD